MKKVAIIQSNYIPWKGYFDAIRCVDEFIIYDDMQYTRRDWRNRNTIKTIDGLQWLTIPVKVSGKFFQKINDTKVSEVNWGRKHWESIKRSYSKAPYFKEYSDLFAPLFLTPVSDYLSEVNFSFISAINKIIGVTTPIRWSSDFKLEDGKTERLVDLCKQVGATDYYSGPAAKDYIVEELFNEANIKLHWFNYSGYLEYPQLFGAFKHSVTILDMIFNVGSATSRFMKEL